MTNWKTELHRAFSPPTPSNKREFLRNTEIPQVSFLHILISQAGYMRKRVWIISAMVYFSALFAAQISFPYILPLISACTPLLALLLVSESGRSECYAMAELELSTRFSLRSVVLARLGLLGCLHFFLLVLLVVLGCGNSTYPPFSVGLYISVPFLLTSFLGLFISQKHRGQDGLYYCVGSTICISVFILASHISLTIIYEEQYLIWWAAGLMALCVGIRKQFTKIMNRTEERLWNWS